MNVRIFLPNNEDILEIHLDVVPNREDMITIKDKTYYIKHRNFKYHQYKHLQYWDLYLTDSPLRI